MDKLKECALIFKSLLQIEYKIILGRKGTLIEFNINFEETAFYCLKLFNLFIPFVIIPLKNSIQDARNDHLDSI